MEEILKDIASERERQDAKWGKQNHHPCIWMTILQEEIGEVAQAVQKEYLGWGKESDKSNYYEELIQAAAVLVAMAESHKGK